MPIRHSKKFSALFAASLALTSLTGCGKGLIGAISAEVPKQAIPSTVDAGLNKFDEAETQRKIEQIVQSPAIKNVERELIAGLLDGTLSTLSDEERSKRIGELTSRAMAGIMTGTAQHIGPIASNMTRGVIGGAMDEALSSARREALTGTMSAVISTTMQSVSEGLREAEIAKSVSSAMSESIGPAVQKTLRENLAPGLAEVLKNEDLRRELGLTMRVMGREMVLGATEALAQKQEPAEGGSLLARATSLASQGARLFGSAAWLLLVVVLALGVWVVKLIAQARRYREDAHRREATALLLEEAAKASEGKPWSDELLSSLEERFKDDKEAASALKRARRAVSRARKEEGPPTDLAGRPRHSIA